MPEDKNNIVDKKTGTSLNSSHVNSMTESQLEVWQYIAVLTSQFSFVIVFTFSSMFTALALTYVASEKYEAATAIFFRPIEVMRLRSQEATAFGSPVPAAAFTVIGKTIDELLQSEFILGRVVDILDLDVEYVEDYSNEPWYIYYYKLTEEYLKQQADVIWGYLKFGRFIESNKTDAAIRTLRANINIEIDDSYISYIIVRDKNNIRAAATVDVLAEQLVIWLKEKERGPLSNRKQQLIDALNEKQVEIDGYRNQLLRLLIENNVSSFEHELEQGNIRISQLESSRIGVLAEVKNLQSEIEAIEIKLNQQNNGSQQGSGRIQADDFKRLTSESISLSISLEGLREQYKALQEEIGSLKTRLSSLSVLDIEYQRINGSYNTASRDHLLIKDALQEVIVREYSIDSEIGILHKATIPTEPVTPIKIYHVSLAAFLGLIVSIGLVYMLSFFNIRILFASKGVKGRRELIEK